MCKEDSLLVLYVNAKLFSNVARAGIFNPWCGIVGPFTFEVWGIKLEMNYSSHQKIKG